MTEVEIPKHTIISYVRDNKGRPQGALIAVREENGKGYRVGYSLCNKLDRFSKAMAVKIALGRAAAGRPPSSEKEPLPHLIRRNIPAFIERCARYYP